MASTHRTSTRQLKRICDTRELKARISGQSRHSSAWVYIFGVEVTGRLQGQILESCIDMELGDRLDKSGGY
jgi:hypothetical protein